MTFSARLWRNLMITAVAAVLLFTVDAAYDVSLHQGEFLSGWLLLATVLLLTLFNVRKKIRVLPIGANADWLQFHIYVGWLSVALFLLHTGLRLPGGWLDGTLATLFVLVAGSGAVGIALSRTLTKRITRRGEEVIFERIPIFLARVREEAEEVVLQCTGETESSTIADHYAKHLRPFFSRPRNFLPHLLASNRGLFALLTGMQGLERYLSPRESEAAQLLSELVRKKDDLDFHYALQATLKGWLFIHVPLTYGMLVLVALHVVLVYAFSGGLG